MSVIKGIARANLKLVELVQTGYIIHGKSVEERMMNFDRIISEHNRKHDKQWLFYDTRLYEILDHLDTKIYMQENQKEGMIEEQQHSFVNMLWLKRMLKYL